MSAAVSSVCPYPLVCPHGVNITEARVGGRVGNPRGLIVNVVPGPPPTVLPHCAKAASASHPCELHCREMVRRGDGP